MRYECRMECLFHCYRTIEPCYPDIKKFAGAEVTEQVKAGTIAEARFMRACAYRNLVMCWGEVPIIENNQAILTDTTVTRIP